MKKQVVAMKMQSSRGGQGSDPKFKQTSSGMGSAPRYTQTGHAKFASPKVTQANSDGSFTGKYKEAAAKIIRPMVNGMVKSSQKGRGSLNPTGRDMGEKMYLGKNEHNRA